MAFVPCAKHGGMFAGGANTAFIRLVDGVESTGGKRQFCSDCVFDLYEWFKNHTVLVSTGTEFIAKPEMNNCGACGGPLEDAQALFISTFFRGAKPQQFYAQICGSCVMETAERLCIA